MQQYLVVRIAQLVPAIFLASIAIWALIYLLPGDPAIRPAVPAVVRNCPWASDEKERPEAFKAHVGLKEHIAPSHPLQ